MQDLVKFLPYLLPLETPVEDDQNLALVSLYFRGVYADNRARYGVIVIDPIKSHRYHHPIPPTRTNRRD